MAYRSYEEQWAEERRQVAARKARAEKRKADLKAVNELPTVSQRVIGRALLWLK